MGKHSDAGMQKDEPVVLVRAMAMVGAVQLAILVIGLVVAFFFFAKSPSASVILFIGASMVFFSLFAIKDIFYKGQKTFLGCLKPYQLVYFLVICIVLAGFLEAGTLVGAATKSPFNLGDWSIQRYLFFVCAVHLFSVLCLEYLPLDFFTCIKVSVERARSRSMFRMALCLMGVLVAGVLGGLCLRLFIGVAAAPASLFCAFIASAVLVLARICRHGSRLRIETGFLVVALSAGIAFIVAVPASNLFSWDDEVHYGNALRLSYISDPEFTSSDLMMTKLFSVEGGHSVDASMGRWPLNFDLTWSEDQIDHLNEELDAGFERGPVQVGEGVDLSVLNYTMIGYIPSAMGLWLGRLLGLPFHMIFALGRIANLLSYCLVCYAAIRIIPCKKALLCALALIPTSLFMASNYAYDPWLISFGFLSIALLVRELASPAPLSVRSASPIFFAFLLGLGPKAVYFPFIGLLFLMPRKKIAPEKRQVYYLAVVALGIIVVLTFLAPLIATNGGGSGDPRGGSDVNSSLQLKHVLADPAGYLLLVIRFLFLSYLVPANVATAMVNLAYLGDLSISCLPFALGILVYLVGLMLVDTNDASRALASAGSKVWALFLFAVALFGICTALYLSFTSVGANDIAGVQSRYFLPFLLPLGLFVFNFKKGFSVNERVCGATVLVVSSALVLVTWWFLLFSRLMV
ncbi:MAG: DUF2142 domain-containing protein [Coriobacteriaceae bacterium]|nr:DUF2142 domain-containing protein [Coriobacteriaceae bacterium]